MRALSVIASKNIVDLREMILESLHDAKTVTFHTPVELPHTLVRGAGVTDDDFKRLVTGVLQKTQHTLRNEFVAVLIEDDDRQKLRLLPDERYDGTVFLQRSALLCGLRRWLRYGHRFATPWV